MLRVVCDPLLHRFKPLHFLNADRALLGHKYSIYRVLAEQVLLDQLCIPVIENVYIGCLSKNCRITSPFDYI